MSIAYPDVLPDSRSFFELFETTGWNRDYGPDEAALSEAISTSWTAISAYDGDQLVGFGRVISDGILHGVIVHLIVRPTFQERGIGDQVLQPLVDHCRSHYICDIQFSCACDKADFNERFGFVSRPDNALGMEWKPGGSEYGS